MCTKCDEIHRWMSYNAEMMNSDLEDISKIARRMRDELECAFEATKYTYHYEKDNDDASL